VCSRREGPRIRCSCCEMLDVAWLSDPNTSFWHCCCRDEYLAMGLLHITNAVSFLNNDCKLVRKFMVLSAIISTQFTSLVR
jgi:hypothetical protein